MKTAMLATTVTKNIDDAAQMNTRGQSGSLFSVVTQRHFLKSVFTDSQILNWLLNETIIRIFLV